MYLGTWVMRVGGRWNKFRVMSSGRLWY